MQTKERSVLNVWGHCNVPEERAALFIGVCCSPWCRKIFGPSSWANMEFVCNTKTTVKSTILPKKFLFRKEDICI